MASLSLYEVLGIPTTATGGDIKAAYRRLARTCHPDVVSVGRKQGMLSSGEDAFKKINSAYSTLSDPDKRASYDRDLYRRPFGSSLSMNCNSAAASGVGGGRRNWETDQCWH
ncbi:Chaperone protein dnaJ 11, chloroplastic [Linum grandiflorum]